MRFSVFFMMQNNQIQWLSAERATVRLLFFFEGARLLSKKRLEMKNGRNGILYLTRVPKLEVETPMAKAKVIEKTREKIR
jgi:hypothetical protein